METLTPTVARVRAYCLKHHLLTPGTVLVAVSGGADSLALLHMLLTLCDEFAVALHAATFDHGIRGAAGAADVEFVRELATTWDVPITTGAADVPALAREWHIGLEEAARKARYAFLTQVAHDTQTALIATGHNQDDQAETVLLHLIRGSGLAGLRGMLPISSLSDTISLIRPLLDTSRAEIDDYVRHLGIQPRVDATNSDTHYTRNRLRHEILPLLAEINPQVRGALSRTAETLRADYAALSATLPTPSDSISGYSLDRERFFGLPIAQQRLLLRAMAQRLAPDTLFTLERIDAALQTDRGKCQLGGDLWFVADDDEVSVRAVPTLPYPAACPSLPVGASIPIDGPGVYSLPGDHWQLKVERIKPDSAVHPLSVILAVDAGKHLVLRTRNSGDRFKPSGLNGHSQRLKETLINIKIRAEWRGEIPLIVVGDEVAWIVAPTEDGPIQRIGHTYVPQPADSRPLWRFTFVQTVQQATY